MVATWKPDPSFYPSPRMAMKAPAERSPMSRPSTRTASPPTISPSSTSTRPPPTMRRSSARSTCPMPATSCTISAGTPAAPACARTRRIRMSSGAIWSCRACARRASTSSTPSPTRGNPKIVKVIEPEEIAEQGRLHAARTPSIAGRRASMSRALGNAEGKAPGRHVPDGPRELRRARPLGDRPRAAAARLRRLVAPRPRHDGDQRMGHAGHLRERPGPRGAARRQVRPPACISGTCTSASTCRRSTSAPEYQLVFELRPAHDPTKAYGFVNCVVSLKDLSASIWTWYRDGEQLGGQEDHRDPGRARRSRACCRRCSRASRPCRRSSPTSTCRWTTASSMSRAGAPATCTSTTSPIRSRRS